VKWLDLLAVCCGAICVTAPAACASPGHRSQPVLSHSPPPSPHSTAAGTLDDSAPYWCDLVPKKALIRVTGISSRLREVRSVAVDEDGSLCGVRDSEKYGPLVVEWNTTGGSNEIASRMKDVAAERPARLPPQLGTGFVASASTAYELPLLAAATFGCGSPDAWIDIFLRRTAPGRDVVADLTGLMRVAQRRFGVIHRCTPRPVRRF
jgi:hypothetical protein